MRELPPTIRLAPRMTHPKISLILSTGEAAWVLSASGDRATLETPAAYPHGSTVVARIESTEHSLRLKVFRCKKVDETFRVDGRIEGATKALRAFLADSLKPPADPA